MRSAVSSGRSGPSRQLSCRLRCLTDDVETHRVKHVPVRRRSFRGANIFLSIAAFFLAALYLLMELPLFSAREEWREGRASSALETLQTWSRLRLRPADFDDAIAVSYLTLGRLEDAVPYLESIRKRPPVLRSWLSKEEVARVLVSRGRYEEFLRYEAAAKRHAESKDLPLYRAAAQLGVGRIEDAALTFGTISRDDVDEQKYDALRATIAERKKGIFTLVFDRAGKAIAQYSISNDDLVAVDRNFASIVDETAGKLTIESRLPELGTASSIETTLDAGLQQAAIDALDRHQGAIVIIDVATNELLAVANNLAGGRLSNFAFEVRLEPGSIIKVLTELAALENGLDVAALFPMKCNGFIEIEKRQFFDWARHGDLATVEDAMAVSCNIAFAQIGRRLGREKEVAFLRAAGFDSATDLGIFDVPLGRIRKPIYTQYELAQASVGLEHETINALHVAMLARMVATGGVFTAPRLVRGRRSLLGEEVPFGRSAVSTRIASTAVADKVTAAMRAVVTSPRGTGRRAVVEGTTIAMKTGTAGSSTPAYDTIVMAFTPAEKPKYAIGIIAQYAGPAEYAGSRITHDLVAQLAAHKQ